MSTYLNNTVQLEHDMGNEIDQSGNVIEKKKVEEKKQDAITSQTTFYLNDNGHLLVLCPIKK
jgi:hypothetical protein